jgi:hypothetical protein
MAREPTRRADPPEQPKPEPPAAAAKAAETPTKTKAKTERPKVSLHLGKASAPAVYATPYGSEPVNIDPKTGRAIAPSAKSAA